MEALSPVLQLQVPVNAKIHTEISDAQQDAQWDAFLRQTPQGNLEQSSLWAAVKESSNRRSLRVKIQRGKEIIAGCQMFLQEMRFVGTVALAIFGPVIKHDEPEIACAILIEMKRVARAQGAKALVVQPLSSSTALRDGLLQQRFQQTEISLRPTATTLIDLRQPLEDILSKMRKKTRNCVRRAQKNGVTVRRGTEADLNTFYEILSAASERQEYKPFDKDYFRNMWQILRPGNHVEIFLAEHEGKALSAHVIAAFGDTVTTKQGGWSGRGGKLRPNEALDWATIQWAKAEGYRYYDFEGIKRGAAEAVAENQEIPPEFVQTPTSFKLGFGGDVALFPFMYFYVFNPLLHWGATQTYPHLMQSQQFKNLLDKLRT